MLRAEMRVQLQRTGELLRASKTRIDHAVLAEMLFQVNAPGSGELAQFTQVHVVVRFHFVDEQVAVAVKLFLEFAIAYVTLMQHRGTLWLFLFDVKLTQVS